MRNGSYFFPSDAVSCFSVLGLVLSGMTDFSREEKFGSAVVFCHKKQLDLFY